MKKLFIFCLTLLMANMLMAQKGSVSKATSYLTKKDLANAKAEIDVAITIEKNAAKSKTWYERGRIYQAIAQSSDEAQKSLDSDAIVKAVEAYNKVIEMEGDASTTGLLSTQNIETMWGEFINAGGTIYGENKYPEAYAKFVEALLVKPEDSITLLYAGVCSQQQENWENTAKHYYKMADLNIASVDVYSTLIYIERAINKDENKALEAVNRAQDAYPTESKFGQEEISILLAMDKLDEAKQKLITSIEADPSNVNLRLNLAIMYDNLATSYEGDASKKEEMDANYELAKEQYLKVVEIDPENYIGNYNVGALYVNQAKQYYDLVRDMDLAEYNKKGPGLTKKADDILIIGLPYMEKANAIKEDADGLRALLQMYKQLKMFDKAEPLMQKIDELEAAAGAE